MTPREAIAILDFGGQYSQLIARRVRDNHVYCELLPPNATVADIRKLNARGIILSGGPASTYEKEAPNVDPALLDLGIPVLGICYGMHTICLRLGGNVTAGSAREFGRVKLQVGK